MTSEQLQNAHRAEPFVPFSLHLADGRVLTIPHREFLSISPGGRTAVAYHGGEDFSIVDVALVTEIEVHRSNQPAQSS